MKVNVLLLNESEGMTLAEALDHVLEERARMPGGALDPWAAEVRRINERLQSLKTADLPEVS